MWKNPLKVDLKSSEYKDWGIQEEKMDVRSVSTSTSTSSGIRRRLRQSKKNATKAKRTTAPRIPPTMAPTGGLRVVVPVVPCDTVEVDADVADVEPRLVELPDVADVVTSK